MEKSQVLIEPLQRKQKKSKASDRGIRNLEKGLERGGGSTVGNKTKSMFF